MTSPLPLPDLPVCLGGEVPGGRRAHAQAAKRARILEAAWDVFRRLGYDGASMNDIADAAKVSKPTLYVYFDSKEGLFAAMLEDLRERHAEAITRPEPGSSDLHAALSGFARGILRKLTHPDHISLLRLVIGASEKFPEIGQLVFNNGLGRGIEFMTAYLEAECRAGRLKIDDCERAAYQFFELVQARNLRRLLLGIDSSIDEATLRTYADDAVRIFLAAHRP